MTHRSSHRGSCCCKMPPKGDRWTCNQVSYRSQPKHKFRARRAFKTWKNIKPNITNFKYSANGIEDPAVRVNLLLILGFDDENDLDGYEVQWVVFLGKNKLRFCINR
jgi:hypothetical protein